MEQSKDLKVIKSRDVEAGLSRSQPWKREPVKPVSPIKGGSTRMVVNLELEMKTKVAVPNSRMSKDSTESESKSKRSGDERSTKKAAAAVSSPVIKACCECYGHLHIKV